MSVVLAVFMLGLGLGGRVLGRAGDRVKSPLRLYAFLEAGIGLYALATAPILDAAHRLFVLAAGRAELGPVASASLKIGLAAAVLTLPSFLMGGTFPALVRALSFDRNDAQRLIGAFYALNIAGAFLGTLATGFLFLELFGERTTLVLCGVLNLGIAALVLAHERRHRSAPASAPPAGETQTPPRSAAAVYALFGLFLSGAVTMLDEVVFVRVLGLVFGVSTYAFSLVLGAFLLGLGGGAFLAGLLARRRPLRVLDFAASQLATAALTALALLSIPGVPRAVAYLRQIPELGFWAVLAGKSVIAVVFVLPLSAAAGLAVPLLIGALAENVRDLGRDVGGAYLVNTLGTVAGSLATGFFLIPALGTERTLRLGVLVPALAAAAGFALFAATRPMRLGAVVAAALVAFVTLRSSWPVRLLIDSDTAGRRRAIGTRVEFEANVAASPREPLFLEEGRNAVVAVVQTADSRALLVNGHPDASDADDMSTQLLLGIVPLIAHPAPRNVCVIGFGSGVTASAVVRSGDVERVDVVELEKAVVAASRFFHHVNGGVETSRKVRFIFDDARSFLVATPRRYDLVISEPSNPWRAGVANLFTADFFAEARRSLARGGVFAQWLQMYGLGYGSVRMVLRTFASSFEETQVWWLDDRNIVLLGAREPFRLSRDRVRRYLTTEFRADRIRWFPGASPDEFPSRYLLGTADLRWLLSDDDTRHTDDRPLLEYEAPREVFTADHRNPERLLAAKLARKALAPPFDGPPPPAEELWIGVSGLYRSIQAYPEALAALDRAGRDAPSPKVLIRAAELALDQGSIAPAEAALAKLASAPGPTEPEVAAEAERIRGRLALARGDVSAAQATLEAGGAVEGPDGVRLLELVVRQRRTADALALSERLLKGARLGGSVGAHATQQIQAQLLILLVSGADPAEVRRLVTSYPPEGEGFPETPRLHTIAMLEDRVGNSPAVLRASRRLHELGVIDLPVLGAELRALTRLGRPEAEAARERLLQLSPSALDIPIPSPFPGGPGGETNVARRP